MRQPETGEIIYGLRAGLAVFATRPDEILRIGHARAVRDEIAALVRFASGRRVPCDEMPNPELDRIAESDHHEGLVLLTRPRPWMTPQALGTFMREGKRLAIALDRVRNPYNVGAILRTCGFFGVDAAIIGSVAAPQPALPPLAVRVAEGGAEHVRLARTTDLADTLARLRTCGVHVVGADGSARVDATTFRFERPTVLVVGNEQGGLTDRVRAQCEACVAVRGSGRIESLNVGVATALLIERMISMSFVRI